MKLLIKEFILHVLEEGINYNVILLYKYIYNLYIYINEFMRCFCLQ